MNDFSDLNHLPAEVKLLIVNGQTLVDETREKLKDWSVGFDLTSKKQLQSDCKEVEKYIKLISKGKAVEKNTKALENAIIRLRTNFNGIVSFFTR